jgi:hypothetical protein
VVVLTVIVVICAISFVFIVSECCILPDTLARHSLVFVMFFAVRKTACAWPLWRVCAYAIRGREQQLWAQLRHRRRRLEPE